MNFTLKQLINHRIDYPLQKCNNIYEDVACIKILRFWSNKMDMWLDFYKSTLDNYFICYLGKSGMVGMVDWYYYDDNERIFVIAKNSKRWESLENAIDWAIKNLDIDLDKPLYNRDIRMVQLIASAIELQS